MLQIINNSNDPYFNLATEEYFLKDYATDEDILLFWVNRPTIVIGKNQNAFAEINQEYVKSDGIRVVRRLSGGGAVYHDLGNLNFTVIKQKASLQQNDFARFAQPVVECLKKLGLNAAFSGRNDIVIDGMKISGNAQYFYKDKVLHHGTLLYNSDLTILGKALNPSQAKMDSKGIASVKSRVANISQFMSSPLPLDNFSGLLGESFKCSYGNELHVRELSVQDMQIINELADQKYRTWEWTYGLSPSMTLWNERRFSCGTVSVYLDVKNGIISQMQICGDYFEKNPVAELEKRFTNVPFLKDQVEAVLGSSNCLTYIKDFSNEELMQLLFEPQK